MKLKMLYMATGEIFENVEVIGINNETLLGEMLEIEEDGKTILINTDFILTAEPIQNEKAITFLR